LSIAAKRRLRHFCVDVGAKQVKELILPYICLLILTKLCSIKKTVRMESISDIKIDLINLITKISDYKRLKSIYSVVKSELETTKISSPQENPVDKFELGKVDIRKGVTKDQIFEEQGNKSITFQEVQELMTDEPWEQSIDELLATLD